MPTKNKYGSRYSGRLAKLERYRRYIEKRIDLWRIEKIFCGIIFVCFFSIGFVVKFAGI